MDKRFENVTKEDMKDFSSVGSERPYLFWTFEVILFGLCFILALPGLKSGITFVAVLFIALCALTALFLIPTIFFSSENRLAQHRKEFVMCKVAGIKILLLAFLSCLCIPAVDFVKSSGEKSLIPVVYFYFALLAAVDILFTVFFWRKLKKSIFSGEARENDAIRRLEKRMELFCLVFFCIFVLVFLLAMLLHKVTSISDYFLTLETTRHIFGIIAISIALLASHCAKLIGRYIYLALFDMGSVIR